MSIKNNIWRWIPNLKFQIRKYSKAFNITSYNITIYSPAIHILTIEASLVASLNLFHVSYVCKCKLCHNTAKLFMRVTRRKCCEVRPRIPHHRRIQHGCGSAAKVLPLQSLRVLNEAPLIYKFNELWFISASIILVTLLNCSNKNQAEFFELLSKTKAINK